MYNQRAVFFADHFGDNKDCLTAATFAGNLAVLYDPE